MAKKNNGGVSMDFTMGILQSNVENIQKFKKLVDSLVDSISRLDKVSDKYTKKTVVEKISGKTANLKSGKKVGLVEEHVKHRIIVDEEERLNPVKRNKKTSVLKSGKKVDLIENTVKVRTNIQEQETVIPAKKRKNLFKTKAEYEAMALANAPVDEFSPEAIAKRIAYAKSKGITVAKPLSPEEILANKKSEAPPAPPLSLWQTIKAGIREGKDEALLKQRGIPVEKLGLLQKIRDRMHDPALNHKRDPDFVPKPTWAGSAQGRADAIAWNLRGKNSPIGFDPNNPYVDKMPEAPKKTGVIGTLKNAFSQIKQGIKDGISLHKKDAEAANENADAHSKLGTAMESASKPVDHLVKKIVGLAAAYFSLRAAKHAMESLLETGKESERMANNNAIAFGNSANALKAYHHFSEMAASGKIPFSAEDAMAGSAEMMRVGLNAEKQFKDVADIAGKTGKSFTDVSHIITSAIEGNTSSLTQLGLTEPMTRFLHSYQAGSGKMRSAVMGLLAQNKSLWKNGASDASNTWDGAMNQIKSTWSLFKETIMGRPDDPNGLYAKVRDTFKKITNWIGQHKHEIMAVGSAIGEVFKRVWSWVEQFFKFVGKKLFGYGQDSEQFTHKLKDMTLRFLVWIELVKNKFVSFVKMIWEHRDTLITFGKLLMGIWAVNKISQFLSFLRPVTTLLARMVGLLNAPMAAGSAGALLAAIATAGGVIALLEASKDKETGGGTDGQGKADVANFARRKMAEIGIGGVKASDRQLSDNSDRGLTDPVKQGLAAAEDPMKRMASVNALKKQIASQKPVNPGPGNLVVKEPIVQNNYYTIHTTETAKVVEKTTKDLIEKQRAGIQNNNRTTIK